MGHATVGYLFTDDPELGGEGYCIGLHRCESFRVALKTTYETERDPVTNAIHHNSKIVKNRIGDCTVLRLMLLGLIQERQQTQNFRCFNYGK